MPSLPAGARERGDASISLGILTVVPSRDGALYCSIRVCVCEREREREGGRKLRGVEDVMLMFDEMEER